MLSKVFSRKLTLNVKSPARNNFQHITCAEFKSLPNHIIKFKSLPNHIIKFKSLPNHIIKFKSLPNYASMVRKFSNLPNDLHDKCSNIKIEIIPVVPQVKQEPSATLVEVQCEPNVANKSSTPITIGDIFYAIFIGYMVIVLAGMSVILFFMLVKTFRDMFT